ncbi:phospholipid--sterol O-acyltransferase isoform X2 [Mercurialis annua]|uniref:phospholipid--sterol O-acyltransferase isoform X2 n=1 Tax=Mercurialis annua TaxID=3986 RepID=UPI002160F023|nr:phospholipid--sterol O-acyltransferase isoform X2 [Mercurialis annua]
MKPIINLLNLSVVAAVLIIVGVGGLRGTYGDSGEEYLKLSGIIIPGFASTQLRAWSFLDCPLSPLDFNPLDLVWLDTTKLLSAVNCWLKCMLLDPYTQADHPECKSRPDSGLSAITELDPGYITGPLSSVWKDWVKWCIEFGIEANAIVAVPYDWRLSPSMLEERDLYFHKLKLTFETTLKLRGGPSIVLAHSLGNHVFRYFLEWLKLEIAPKHYNQWLDKHIHAYFAVGAPLLGATETVKGTLFGETFGLPVSEGTARLMFNSFSSSLWMMPFSKYCTSDNPYWKHFSGSSRKSHQTYHCEEQEFQSNYSGWPTNLVNIEIPSTRATQLYPSFAELAQTNLSSVECGYPTTQLSFSAREVSDGTLFKAIENYDSDSKRLLYLLERSYHGDPVLNPLTPWERPPIKNVFCIYGVEMKTEGMMVLVSWQWKNRLATILRQVASLTLIIGSLLMSFTSRKDLYSQVRSSSCNTPFGVWETNYKTLVLNAQLIAQCGFYCHIKYEFFKLVEGASHPEQEQDYAYLSCFLY